MSTSRNMLLAGVSVLAIGAGSQQATADDLSYTFLEVAGTYSNPDVSGSTFINQIAETTTTGGDGLGGSIRASIALPEFLPFIGFHVTGEYIFADIDYNQFSLANANQILDGNFSQTQNEWRLAAGAHVNLADRVSAFAELGFSRNDFGDIADFGEPASSGFDARVGLRGMLTENFEVNGFVRFNPNAAQELIETENLITTIQDEGFTYNVGARYKIFSALSLVADYEFGEDVSRLRAGIRLSW